MVPYRLIFALALCLAAAGAVYVVCRFHKLDFVHRIARKSRLLGWLVSLLPVAVAAAFLLVNLFSPIVVLVHLVVIWVLCDLIGLIVKRCAHLRPRRYWAGMTALVITAVYLGVGWYNAHHVTITRYTFTSEKLDAPLRVALVADSHLGITLDGEDFMREMARVQAQQPDVVVVAGDYVDDDTEKADMLTASAAFRQFDVPVYFIYGNHDKGYFRYRNFTAAELETALTENGVIILEDESALVDGWYYVIGRQDRSIRSRAGMAELTAGLDESKYMILLDHQPNDYANEAASPVDLVLSGHTHGGHLFPAGQIGLMMGANDRRYGTEVRNGTVFVVTSGISGWAIPFKTGTFSEVVILDILPERQ